MNLSAARLAHSIEQDIVARDWPVGEVLGSEAQLLEQHQVGRSVLREAVRILETHGVARRRQGPGGGLVVMAPDAGAILDATRLFLGYRGTQLTHLYAVWAAMEALAVDAVLPDLTPRQLEKLRSTLAAEADWDARTRALSVGRPNVHLDVAQFSKNPVLELFLQTVFSIAVTQGAKRMPSEAAAWLRSANAAFVEALAFGDRGLAHTQLRRIINRLERSNRMEVTSYDHSTRLR